MPNRTIMKVIPFIFMALRNTERSGNKWKARGEPNAEWNFGF